MSFFYWISVVIDVALEVFCLFFLVCLWSFLAFFSLCAYWRLFFLFVYFCLVRMILKLFRFPKMFLMPSELNISAGMQFTRALKWAVTRFSYLLFVVCLLDISCSVSNLFFTFTLYIEHISLFVRYSDMWWITNLFLVSAYI